MSKEPGRVVLAAEDIVKTYRSGERRIDVLRGVDLAIREGESVSIRGESGSGKTTLLNILAGLERADAGRLFWQGEQVSGRSLNHLAVRRRGFIGMVFQAYYLVPELNALDNVILAGRIAGKNTRLLRERARALLARVGLAERVDHLPSRLSGGECQRVAIARALINEPPLILADEPTGNLDERTAEDVIDLLLGLCRETRTALVLVTHNAEHARRTSRQCRLHLGRLEA
ncbi:MAG: ABC transporter ATP-binding protein [Verrucomicrobia bacterium]|nr:MAG: ABC transporter ATP-binding protein [Verrucomicrobiota bacterium]